MPYKRIWIEHFGPIPKDGNGRSFEIHHINGIHSDNRIENLKCVSIEEHYQIHFDQGDMLAAAAIARRMMVAPDTQFELNRAAGKEAFRKKKGFHAIPEDQKRINSAKGGKAHIGMRWWTNGEDNYLGFDHPSGNWKLGRTVTGTGIKVGTTLGVFWNNGSENKRATECPGPEWRRGRFLTPEQKAKRIDISKNIIRTPESNKARSLKLKNKPQTKVTCPHCGKAGGSGAMARFHFERCKHG